MDRTLVINTGGESRRTKETIGVDYSKSWLMIDEYPIIFHNLKNLGTETSEIIIITRNEEESSYFKKKLNSLKKSLGSLFQKIKLIVEDENIKFSGPVRGLISAISQCQTEIIWWIPSDHPFIKSNIFHELESNLTPSNIVSIFSKNSTHDFHFEPQIFVITKSTLTHYSFYISNRITDIYRLIPDVTLMIPSSNEEERSLIGINTRNDLEFANTNKEVQFNGDMEFLKIERFCNLNNDLNTINDTVNLNSLINNSQFFLLRRLIELQIIKPESFSINELTFLEWKYWKNKNFLIGLHCGKDYLRLEGSNTKEKTEILEFMKKF
jgi:molybdopterin-guanine dinucleotide biosynthesis protein A